ncbi:MAG: DsrE/DsrF/TusD sulfur relay family protein [Promethearchaeota archaeon]
MKIGFVLMTEYMKFQHINTMLKMIESAKKKGHTISGIFLFGTGVLNLQNKSILGKGVKDLPKELEKLGAEKIPIFACQTWADIYGINENNKIEHASISGLGELSNITKEVDKLIVFGSQL